VLRGRRSALGIQVELVVMRNVFVAYATRDAGIGASPKPAPPIVRIRIFRVDCEINFCMRAREQARDAKDKFAVLVAYIESLRLFPLAPAPVFPPAEEADDRCSSYFSRKEQVAL